MIEFRQKKLKLKLIKISYLLKICLIDKRKVDIIIVVIFKTIAFMHTHSTKLLVETWLMDDHGIDIFESIYKLYFKEIGFPYSSTE